MRFFYPLKKSWPVLDPHIELLRLLLASTRLVLGFTYESDGLIAHCDLTIEVQDMGPDKYLPNGKQFYGNLSFFLFRSKPPSQRVTKQSGPLRVWMRRSPLELTSAVEILS